MRKSSVKTGGRLHSERLASHSTIWLNYGIMLGFVGLTIEIFLVECNFLCFLVVINRNIAEPFPQKRWRDVMSPIEMCVRILFLLFHDCPLVIFAVIGVPAILSSLPPSLFSPSGAALFRIPGSGLPPASSGRSYWVFGAHRQ
jgi:hypothetical protein